MLLPLLCDIMILRGDKFVICFAPCITIRRIAVQARDKEGMDFFPAFDGPLICWFAIDNCVSDILIEIVYKVDNLRIDKGFCIVDTALVAE